MKTMSLSLSQRINLSFSLIVFVIVLSGFMFYNRAIDNEAHISAIETSDIKGIEVAKDIRLTTSDHWMETNTIYIKLNHSSDDKVAVIEEGRDHLLNAEQQIKALYANYESTITLEKDKILYAELEQKLSIYFGLSQQLLERLTADPQSDISKLFEKQSSAWQSVRATLGDMIKLNEKSYENSIATLHNNITKNIYTAIAAVVISVLIATLCGYYLRRAIMTPIASILGGMHKMGEGILTYRIEKKQNDEFGSIITGFNDMAESLKELVVQTQGSAVHLSSSITELAATSKQQQTTVTETAATTTEIGATSKQISATAKELLHTVSEAADTAAHTSRLAQTSQQSVSNMDDVMRQLSSAAEMVSGKLALLSERATGINQVVTTIMKVADQTNLLSLNAAIEAEKAGEYGKGFTVVANEIRRLADQTAIATYDIEQMVREIQSAVAAGVMGIDKFSEEVRRGSSDMEDVSEQLSMIIEQVQELAPHIQQVNEGMLHQAEGAEQINLALSQLADATSQTVDSLAQTTSAIDNMSDVASKLRSGVNRFKV